MRVVLDAACRGPGGVSRHVIDLACGLQQAGVEVLVGLARDDSALTAEMKEAGLSIIDNDKHIDADIVHFHLADTYDQAAFRRMVRRRRTARVVVTEHLPHSNASDPALPFGGRRSHAYWGKTLLKRSQLAVTDKTIVLSTNSAEFMSARYHVSGKEFAVVRNGIPEPAEPARDSWGGRLVVAVGTLAVQKGFDVLIDAAAAQQRWHVVIYGDGSAREQLAGQIRDMRAPVELAGWVGRDAIPIASAALLCIPSRWEASPYVAMEAMWSATPVVASSVDGLGELLADTGLLVPPDDPQALGDAVSALVSEPERARELGLHGLNRVRSRFSFESMIDGVRDVYRDIVNK